MRLTTIVWMVLWGLVSSPAVLVAQWPQWRGPARDGHCLERGFAFDWQSRPPQLVWTAKGLGSGYASLSIQDGRIFTTGNFDEEGQGVVALDEKTGGVLWRTLLTEQVPRHGYPGSRCTPTVDGDRLYVVTSSPQEAEIACLAVQDGRVLWRQSFRKWKGRMMSGWGFSESPLVDGDWVVCTPGGADGLMVALDKMTGEEIWRCTLAQAVQDGHGGVRPGAGYASIVVSHGAGVKQYVQLLGCGLVGVRAQDGKLLWHYGRIANSTANIPTPVVRGDFVFGTTGYNTGAALLRLVGAADGVRAEEVYFLDGRTLQNKHGGVVLHDGYIYCGHGNGRGLPICVEFATGKVMWGPERGPGRGEASVIVVDDHLIFRFQDGVVALVEATPQAFRVLGTFTPAIRQPPSWAHPAVANGRLYLREQDWLMCYDLKPGG